MKHCGPSHLSGVDTLNPVGNVFKLILLLVVVSARVIFSGAWVIDPSLSLTGCTRWKRQVTRCDSLKAALELELGSS